MFWLPGKPFCKVFFASALCLAGSAVAQGIFTCVDAKGRKITSDRPIADCIDRTQQEMTPSGTIKRVLGPTLTAQERNVQEAKEKVEADVRMVHQEEKRRDRALLSRYPDPSAHDKERGASLSRVDEVTRAAAKRSLELAEQRVVINAGMEFYKKDPDKAPQALKKRLEENDISIGVQQRFISEQDAEKRRISSRFDEELVKLKRLWLLASVPVVAPIGTAGASSAKSASKTQPAY